MEIEEEIEREEAQSHFKMRLSDHVLCIVGVDWNQ